MTCLLSAGFHGWHSWCEYRKRWSSPSQLKGVNWPKFITECRLHSYFHVTYENLQGKQGRPRSFYDSLWSQKTFNSVKILGYRPLYLLMEYTTTHSLRHRWNVSKVIYNGEPEPLYGVDIRNIACNNASSRFDWENFFLSATILQQYEGGKNNLESTHCCDRFFFFSA